MSNDVFDCLFRERIQAFRSGFSSTATDLFLDPTTRKLRHSGEYGMYRESVVRDFLKFIVPRSLDISTGFVISSMNDVSTQCDIVIFDPRMTPLYQGSDRHRFFPVESVFCIGEVKSTVSKKDLADALNKLASIKCLGERIKSPVILGAPPSRKFDPIGHPYDLVPSILICQKFGFPFTKIPDEIDALYESSVLHRHKHNMVLSLEDGLLSYTDQNGKNLPYSRFVADLKHRFTVPGDNEFAHYRLFGTYMFMLTSSKTLLYPEFSDYMGTIECSFKRDQA